MCLKEIKHYKKKLFYAIIPAKKVAKKLNTPKPIYSILSPDWWELPFIWDLSTPSELPDAPPWPDGERCSLLNL